MSWNGSDQATSSAGKGSAGNAAVRSSHPPKAPRTKHGLLALLIILALAGAALYFFTRPAPPPPAPTPVPKTPRHVSSPAPTPAQKVTPAKLPKPVEKPRKIEYWEQPTTNGLSPCQILKWKHMRQRPPVYTNNCFVKAPPQPYAIFHTRVENELAMLLTVEPGTIMVGSPEYGDAFQEEFLKSCEVPIVDDPNDSPEDKELKAAMRELKIGLCDRIRAGESLADIVRDSRNEMARLWTVKRDLVNMTHQMIKENAQTMSDVDDCLSAMNKMLEAKGMSPIEMDPLTKESLLLQLGLYEIKDEGTNNE